MSMELPPGVTPEIVYEMTKNLRLWLSDQSMAPTRRKEAREYLAKLWPPMEEDYQRWLKDPNRREYD